MRLNLNTSLIYIVLLMLRRLPTTLSFLGSRILPSRSCVRTFASAEPIVSLAATKTRTLISKLNLSLGKRARINSGELAKRGASPHTTTKAVSEPAVPLTPTSAFGSLGLSEEIVKALDAQGKTPS